MPDKLPITLEPLLKACYNYCAEGVETKETVVISPIKLTAKTAPWGDYTQVTWACSRGYFCETLSCIYANHHKKVEVPE